MREAMWAGDATARRAPCPLRLTGMIELIADMAHGQVAAIRGLLNSTAIVPITKPCSNH